MIYNLFIYNLQFYYIFLLVFFVFSPSADELKALNNIS